MIIAGDMVNKKKLKLIPLLQFNLLQILHFHSALLLLLLSLCRHILLRFLDRPNDEKKIKIKIVSYQITGINDQIKKKKTNIRQNKTSHILMMTIYIWVLLFVSFVSFVFHLFHSHPYWFWSFFMYLIYLFSLLISTIIDIWPNKNIKSFISGLYWMIFLVEIDDQFVGSSLKWWWFKLVILILKLLLYCKSDIILLVFFYFSHIWPMVKWNETKSFGMNQQQQQQKAIRFGTVSIVQ